MPHFSLDNGGKLSILDEKEKSTIKEMVRKYGSLDPIAIKLSIIATALFIKDKFGVKANE